MQAPATDFEVAIEISSSYHHVSVNLAMESPAPATDVSMEISSSPKVVQATATDVPLDMQATAANSPAKEVGSDCFLFLEMPSRERTMMNSAAMVFQPLYSLLHQQ